MSSELFHSSSRKKGMKFDPRTKLLLLITLCTLMLSTSNTGLMLYMKPLLALIPFVLLLLTAKYAAGILYFGLYALGFSLEIFWSAFGNPALGFVILTVSAIITRFTPCVIAAFFLMTTTSVSEFIGSMKKMHMTDKITIPLSVIFRFFPTVKEDAGAINAAMKMRGITPKSPLLMMEYRMVPLIISTVKAGEDLSCSALTRGLGSPKKRTNLCDIGFHFWDWILCGICICAVLIFCFQAPICSLLNI